MDFLPAPFDAYRPSLEGLSPMSDIARTQVLVGPIQVIPPQVLRQYERGSNVAYWLLLDKLPLGTNLTRALALGLRVGVYMPSEQVITHTTLLGLTEVRVTDTLDLLKRLAALQAKPFVVADAGAILDAHNFMELLVGLTDELYLLGEMKHPARALELQALWQSLKA